MVISSFWSTKVGLFTFAAIFGFLSNGYGFVKATAARLLEFRWFADAYSWMLLFEGIAIMVGPFIAGYDFALKKFVIAHFVVKVKCTKFVSTER